MEKSEKAKILEKKLDKLSPQDLQSVLETAQAKLKLVGQQEQEKKDQRFKTLLESKEYLALKKKAKAIQGTSYFEEKVKLSIQMDVEVTEQAELYADSGGISMETIDTICEVLNVKIDQPQKLTERVNKKLKEKRFLNDWAMDIADHLYELDLSTALEEKGKKVQEIEKEINRFAKQHKVDTGMLLEEIFGLT